MGVVFFLAFCFIVFWILYGVYSLIAYVVQGISCIKIAQKLGVSHGWMGFVPVACYYLLGKMAEEDCKRTHPDKKGKKWRVIYSAVLGVYIVLTGFSGAIFFVGSFLIPGKYSEIISDWDRLCAISYTLDGIAMLILLIAVLFLCIVTCIVFYKIYHAMAGKSAWWMLLLTALVPLAQQVILLVLAFSKKYPVESPFGESDTLAQGQTEEHTEQIVE